MKYLLPFLVLLIVGCALVDTAPTQVDAERSWTVPFGDAVVYDGRLSLSEDSLRNHWSSCAVWPTATPRLVGTRDMANFSITVETDTPYYFAIKSADESGNWSGISNIFEQTWADTIPPTPIGDLQ